jgi:glucose/arabinose dehydrogenase
VNGFIFFFLITVFPEKTIDFETIADGLNSPVACANSGDGTNRIFIADQIGKIYIIKNDELVSDPFLDISDKIVTLSSAYDERGLLGITFHPDYKNNGRFFLYYSAPKAGEEIDHESILSEFHVSEDPDIADPDSEKIIFRVDQPESNHNGGQIEFGPDGYLYIGLGDGGGAGDQHGVIGNGQDINTSLGSILRIDVDGEDPYSIPEDNPFVGVNGLDEIFAWGFRNPWKFSFNKETGALIVADVGQDNWEEIDIVEKGENYGWRIMEGDNPYDPDLADFLGIDIDTLAKPIHEYSHSVGKSITGGYIYRGTQNSDLVGKYIFGDWSANFVIPNGKLYFLEETEPDVWERFDLIPSESFNRFVLSFGEDENGEIYLLSKTTLGPSGNTGDVRRIIFN